MKASDLLEDIQNNLKDYPIDYLKNKVNDDRYPDSLTKKLAEYNASVYDDIYAGVNFDDFEIKDKIIKNVNDDLTFYFDRYGPGDEESQKFTRNITLYLALIAKKPLHPYRESKKNEVYFLDGKYYCRNRVKFIRDEKSLCRYCVCKNEGFYGMF